MVINSNRSIKKIGRSVRVKAKMAKFSQKYILYIFLFVLLSYFCHDFGKWSSMIENPMDPPKYDRNFRCKLFQLDRHAYKDLPVPNPIKLCNYVTPKFVTVKDSNRISLDVDNVNFSCCYTPLVPTKKNWSKLTLDGYCKHVGKNKILTHHSFLQISCRGPHGNHTQLLATVPPVFKAQRKFSDEVSDMNVIVLLFDGISRRSFNVHLPLTKTALLRMEAVDFQKYMRVSKNVFENFMVLTTGLTEDEYFICLDEKMMKIKPDCPFIWKRFSEKGYLTAFLEDTVKADDFNFEKMGFPKKPFDYYLKPFNLYSRKFKYHVSNKNERDCVGNKIVFINFLEYSKSILRQTKMIGHKHFTIMYSNLVKNETTLQSLDRNFYDFLRFLKTENLTENTIIFILSNQGSEDRRMINFESPEVNLPFLQMYLPPRFKRDHPEAQRELIENTQRLTTAYDVHETLKVILRRNFDNKNDYARSLSLFSEIPKYRSCTDAGIPQTYCSCTQIYMEKMEASQIHNIAIVTLNHINTELGLKQKHCSKLEIDKIINGTKIPIRKNTYDIKVQFSTKPGSGIFQVHVFDEGHKYNVKNITRLSPYRHESCIKDYDLEQFCYCPELKSEL